MYLNMDRALEIKFIVFPIPGSLQLTPVNGNLLSVPASSSSSLQDDEETELIALRW